MNTDQETGDVAGSIQGLIFVAGLVAIAVGFALWALPAGLIVGGLEAAGTVIAHQRGERRKETRR